jgi:hypothetical protein
MYINIKMQAKKTTAKQAGRTTLTVRIEMPILPGSVSTAASTCGKPHCACKARPPKLHGLYYRWTGFLEGKRTTKTLSKEVAEECQRRIDNYRKFQRQVEKILARALVQAPWNERPE